MRKIEGECFFSFCTSFFFLSTCIMSIKITTNSIKTKIIVKGIIQKQQKNLNGSMYTELMTASPMLKTLFWYHYEILCFAFCGRLQSQPHTLQLLLFVTGFFPPLESGWPCDLFWLMYSSKCGIKGLKSSCNSGLTLSCYS